jgi:hypothetical protein
MKHLYDNLGFSMEQLSNIMKTSVTITTLGLYPAEYDVRRFPCRGYASSDFQVGKSMKFQSPPELATFEGNRIFMLWPS